MNSNKTFRTNTLVFLLLILGTLSVHADDTEVYLGSNLTSQVQPNIVFIIDNSGSMRTADIEAPVVGGVTDFDPRSTTAPRTATATAVTTESTGTTAPPARMAHRTAPAEGSVTTTSTRRPSSANTARPYSISTAGTRRQGRRAISRPATVEEG
jgi:hypothetical protein